MLKQHFAFLQTEALQKARKLTIFIGYSFTFDNAKP
jgi:hypothetical protein